jgi:hypothetical protein
MTTLILDGGGDNERNLQDFDSKYPLMTGWSLGAFGDLPTSDLENSYDWSRSTEDNYKCHESDGKKKQLQCEFYGHFKTIRQRLLDHKFHAGYSEERQAVQDSILLSLLPTTVVHDKDTGRECSAPTENWIVFTAGCYGSVNRSIAMSAKTLLLIKMQRLTAILFPSFFLLFPTSLEIQGWENAHCTEIV